MVHVKDFSVAGAFAYSGSTMKLRLALSTHGGGGSIAIPGATLDIIVVGPRGVYIKADEKSWQKLLAGSKPEAQLLANRWIKIPPSNSGVSAFAQLTYSNQFMRQLLAGAPSLTEESGSHSWAGHRVTVLTDRAGDVLDIAATGAPYLLRLVGTGSSAGSVVFSKFGSTSLPKAPPNATVLPGTK